jgi:hypothetical protein
LIWTIFSVHFSESGTLGTDPLFGAKGSTGFNHLMFPKWFVGWSHLGTISPLTIGIDAEKQWVYSFRCQS